jgi:hypothetical protein
MMDLVPRTGWLKVAILMVFFQFKAGCYVGIVVDRLYVGVG